SPVAIIYPDRGEGDLGTLFIPNTVALVKGAPHPKAAGALADYLLSPDVESALAKGPSAQIPLNPKTPAVPRLETPKTVHALDVALSATDTMWDTLPAFVAEALGGSSDRAWLVSPWPHGGEREVGWSAGRVSPWAPRCGSARS